MGRHKKNKSISIKENKEVVMSDKEEILETALVVQEEDVEPIYNQIELANQELDKARQELEDTKRQIEEKKAVLKVNDRREISQEEKDISAKQLTASSEKRAALKKLEDQKAFDKVLVTGKFMNRRSPGQSVKLPYIKYAEDPVKWYPFVDGKTYTIPRGFADQLNEYYHTPQFTQRIGPMDGNDPDSQIESVDTSNKKYAFVALNFQ